MDCKKNNQHHSEIAYIEAAMMALSNLLKAVLQFREGPNELPLKILENNTECLVKDVVCVPNNKELQIHLCEYFLLNLCTKPGLHVSSRNLNLGTLPEVQGKKATTCSCSLLLNCQEQGREPLEVCFHDSECIVQEKAESMS